MAEHRALRLAGGAAGEHDLREVVRIDFCRLDGRRSPGQVRQGLDEQDGQPELARRRLRLGARDHQLRPGLGHDLGPEVDRVPDVQRHRHGTKVGDREERDPPLRPVDRPQDDPVPLADAGVMDHARGLGHDATEIAVAPGPRPEERPDHERGPAIEAFRAGPDEIDQGVHVGASVQGQPTSRANLARVSAAPSSRAVKWLNTTVLTSSSASRFTLRRAAA